ncbi:DNA-binding protein [Ruminococcaceae bacterium OttesenSCG-928-D13]|nr:DNA-binding protein [Ruminococcaceae bacterium OttesenSCG-928-D13]
MGEETRTITLEMLTPAQREVAEVIGLESYLKLVEVFAADAIYIPKYDTLIEDQYRIQRDEEIIAKYTGFNLKPLAKEYGLTPRSLYNIIPRSVRIAKKNAPMDGQLSIDDLQDETAV